LRGTIGSVVDGARADERRSLMLALRFQISAQPRPRDDEACSAEEAPFQMVTHEPSHRVRFEARGARTFAEVHLHIGELQELSRERVLTLVDALLDAEDHLGRL